MGLIGKPRGSRDGHKRRVARDYLRKGPTRPNFRPERRRRDTKYLAKAAGKGFGGKPMFARPAVETAIGIVQKITSEKIGPIFRRAPCLAKLCSQSRARFGKVTLRGARDRVGIAYMPNAEIRRQPGQHKVEDLCTLVLKAIQMCVERIVQQYVARADAKAPLASAFLVTAGKDDRRVGLIVTMARNPIVCVPTFPADRYPCKTTHRLPSAFLRRQSDCGATHRLGSKTTRRTALLSASCISTVPWANC